MKPAIEIIKDNCVGCYGCFNSCNNNAIDFNLNKEGFLFPFINYKKCIQCGQCQKYCPILNNDIFENLKNPLSFAAWSKDDQTRIQSSSGGIFTEIAKIVIKEGGVVFGVSFDELFRAKHIMIEKEEDINYIRGSKYIQSHIEDMYKKAISIALQGRKVLFSGTPCQISALNLFIRNNPEIELYTCEVICHGVASESIFLSYLHYISQLYSSGIKKFNFRDKTLGWTKFGTKIIFNNDNKYFSIHKRDPFMIGFLRNIYLRSICYTCPFAKIPRVSDITLSDFWGVPKTIFDQRGVSAVIINTPKGKTLFNKVENIYKTNVTLDQIAFYNIRLVNGNLKRNPYRKNFYELLEKTNFQVVMQKYLKPSPWFLNYLFMIKDLIRARLHGARV